MAAPNAYTQGIDERIFVQTETTYGETPTAIPAATDAINHIKPFSATLTTQNKIRMDRKSSRSALERFLGKRSGSWSLKKYILPAGAATAPDDTDLWEAALGTLASTNNYSLATLITKSLRIFQSCGNFSRTLIGCVVDRMLIELPAGQPAMVTFSGFCKDIIYTGTGGISSGAAASSTLVLDAGHGKRVQVGSLISLIDATDASEEVERVTVLATDTLTIAGTLTPTYVNADTFYPAQQTSMTTAGVPIPDTENSISVGGVSSGIELVSGSVELVNNFRLRDQERGQVTPTGFASNMDRSVRATLALYHKQTLTGLFQESLQVGELDVVLTIGSVAGRICVVSFTDWSPEQPSEEQVGDEGDVVATYSGQAIGVSGNEELTVDFQ